MTSSVWLLQILMMPLPESGDEISYASLVLIVQKLYPSGRYLASEELAVLSSQWEPCSSLSRVALFPHGESHPGVAERCRGCSNSDSVPFVASHLPTRAPTLVETTQILNSRSPGLYESPTSQLKLVLTRLRRLVLNARHKQPAY